MFNFNKKFSLKLVAIVTLCAVATSFPMSIVAKTQSELESELATLREQKENIDSQIASLGNEIDKEEETLNSYINAATNVYEQISLYDSQIESLNKDIEAKNKEINAKNKEINAKLKEIQKKEEEHKKSDEKFKSRLSAMYKSSGTNSLLNAIFGSSSFSDMLTQTQVLKNISKADKELMNELLNQKRELEKMKEQLEGQRAQIEKAKAQIQSKKSEIEDVRSVQVEKKKELEQLQKKSNEIIASKEAQQHRLKSHSQSLLGDEAKIKELIQQAEAEANKPKPQPPQPPAGGGGNSGNSGGGSSGGGSTGGGGSTPSPDIPNSNGWLWPVGGYNWVSQGYHGGHTAIDIAAAEGTPIYASRAGTVIFAGYGNGSNGFNRYGNAVLIRHDNGYYTLYAHAHYLNVSAGQTVSQGQVIGGVGNTGESFGNHLHFEVRDGVQGNRLNPFNFVSK